MTVNAQTLSRPICRRNFRVAKQNSLRQEVYNTICARQYAQRIKALFGVWEQDRGSDWSMADINKNHCLKWFVSIK